MIKYSCLGMTVSLFPKQVYNKTVRWVLVIGTPLHCTNTWPQPQWTLANTTGFGSKLRARPACPSSWFELTNALNNTTSLYRRAVAQLWLRSVPSLNSFKLGIWQPCCIRCKYTLNNLTQSWGDVLSSGWISACEHTTMCKLGNGAAYWAPNIYMLC